MPPKSRAPTKLTAAQLAAIDVIDLCRSSSEDEVEVADPHAVLEPVVESLACLQPSRCANQEAGMEPHEAGIENYFSSIFLVLCKLLYLCPCTDPAMLAPLPPASTCVDEDAEHAVAGANSLWFALYFKNALFFQHIFCRC